MPPLGDPTNSHYCIQQTVVRCRLMRFRCDIRLQGRQLAAPSDGIRPRDIGLPMTGTNHVLYSAPFDFRSAVGFPKRASGGAFCSASSRSRGRRWARDRNAIARWRVQLRGMSATVRTCDVAARSAVLIGQPLAGRRVTWWRPGRLGERASGGRLPEVLVNYAYYRPSA